MDNIETLKWTLIRVMNELITEAIQQEINDVDFVTIINNLTKDEIYRLLLTKILQQLVLTIYIMEHPESKELDSIEIQKRAMIEIGTMLVNISNSA